MHAAQSAYASATGAATRATQRICRGGKKATRNSEIVEVDSHQWGLHTLRALDAHVALSPQNGHGVKRSLGRRLPSAVISDVCGTIGHITSRLRATAHERRG